MQTIATVPVPFEQEARDIANKLASVGSLSRASIEAMLADGEKVNYVLDTLAHSIPSQDTLKHVYSMSLIEQARAACAAMIEATEESTEKQYRDVLAGLLAYLASHLPTTVYIAGTDGKRAIDATTSELLRGFKRILAAAVRTAPAYTPQDLREAREKLEAEQQARLAKRQAPQAITAPQA